VTRKNGMKMCSAMLRSKIRFLLTNYGSLMSMQRKEPYLIVENVKQDAIPSDLKRISLLEEVNWRQKSKAI